MSTSDTNTVPQPQAPYGRFITTPHFTLLIGPSKKPFYIHKELLGGISLELRKHTHNEMKEGQENSMALEDVLDDTAARFIEWAYTSDYPEEVYLPSSDDTSDGTESSTSLASLAASISGKGKLKADPSSKDQASKGSASATPSTPSSARLLHHARVYVFAERFNILGLKELAFTKITSLLRTIDSPAHPRDASDVIQVLSYAFENLPLTNSGEKLLDYLSSYAAWSFESLRKDSSFWTLIISNSDFLKSVLLKVNQANSAPWPTGSTSPSAGAKKNLKAKADFLKRQCNVGNCRYVGAFRAQCASCAKYDTVINDESGDMLDMDRVKNLSGVTTSLRLTCSSCNYTAMPNLYCGKCNYCNNYTYV